MVKYPERSREEIEALQRNWYKDPCWDIEDSEGFEAHREELKQFSAASNAHWAKLAQNKHDKQASLICPSMSAEESDEFIKCRVELCAQWDPDRECCGMLPYKEVTISGGINTRQY